MNNIERWVIGAICAFMMVALGYIISQLDLLKSQISDVRVQITQVSQKLDDHMRQHSERQALIKSETQVDP